MRATTWSFPAEPRGVPEARRAVTEFVRAQGAESPPVEAVRLAVTEAVTNAVLHGYRSSAPGTVTVAVAVDPGRVVTVSVRDDGDGLRPNPASPGLGMGLDVIRALATRAEVRTPPTGQGTEVQMVFAPTA